jgi:hypothetical protein
MGSERSVLYFHRWHHLGPASFSAGAPDALACARHAGIFSRQCRRMSPASFSADFPNALAWAQIFPPMVSLGPINVFGGCRRCPCVGPTHPDLFQRMASLEPSNVRRRCHCMGPICLELFQSMAWLEPGNVFCWRPRCPCMGIRNYSH